MTTDEKIINELVSVIEDLEYQVARNTNPHEIAWDAMRLAMVVKALKPEGVYPALGETARKVWENTLGKQP